MLNATSRSMKPGKDAEIDQLIAVANQLLDANAEKPLDWKEEAILKHVLGGEPLKTAHVKVENYQQTTIERQIAPRLWKRMGLEFGSKNVKALLKERLTQQQAPFNSREGDDHLHSPLALMPASVPAAAPTNSHAHPAHSTPKRILHNLPQRLYSKFIGRQPEVDRLRKLLSPKHPAHRICITGMGGVGKTSLALACAWQCLHDSSAPEPPAHKTVFDLIIFVTARQYLLDYSGLHKRHDPHTNDLMRQIISMLDRNGLLVNASSATSFTEQVALIYKILENYRTLLIVDNLEAVENQQDINDFLCDLPSSVKSIITTREGVTGEPIRLTVLPEADGLDLVRHQASHMGVVLKPEHSQTLYQLTGGLPLAIHLAIGQLCKGYSLERLQAQLLHPTGNIVKYCFENEVQSLQHRPAYWLLLATALFPEPATREALIAVALPEQDPDLSEDELVHLQTVSLIDQENSSIEAHSRYRISPPLRAYIHAHLENQPQFEQTARDRWANWYLQRSEAYRQQDPTEWQGQFTGLDQEWDNLQAVAEWYIASERHLDLFQLWQNLKFYFYMVGRGASGMRFWQTGLIWAEWLIQTALHQQDPYRAGTLMFFRAWVLMGTNHPTALPEAETLLEQAWNLREYQDLKDQANIARQLGLLKIKQRQIEQSQDWLQQSDMLLQKATIDDRKRQECLSYTRYYQGWAAFVADDMSSAKHYFEAALNHAIKRCSRGALDDAQNVNLDRLSQIIETFLADVAIRQGNLGLAKALLEKGLRLAEMKADQRRIADIKQSLAKLAQAEGNVTKQQREATESLQLYQQLGMITEAQEVQALLNLQPTRKPQQT